MAKDFSASSVFKRPNAGNLEPRGQRAEDAAGWAVAGRNRRSDPPRGLQQVETPRETREPTTERIASSATASVRRRVAPLRPLRFWPTATPSPSTWEDDREAADATGVPLPAPTASERQTHPRRRPGTGLRCAASHNPNI